MTTNETTTAGPISTKALRRWIDDQYEGAARSSNWTVQECMDFIEEHHAGGLDAFRQSPYRAWDTYQAATPAAREAVDAVFAAIINVASPLVGVDHTPLTGVIGCSFTWHDGAQYRVEITKDGLLARLYRLELTGRWVREDDGELAPDVIWRTVRAFSRDRAGKVLAPALYAHRSTTAWTRAVEA